MTDIYRSTGRPNTARVTVVSSNSEPASQTAFITVDRVHSIIRAAEAGDTRPLFGLYRDILLADSHLQGELAKRKLAVLGEQMTIIPRKKNDPAAKATADFCDAMVDDFPGWNQALVHLLDSCLWPVSIVEKVYAKDGAGGFRLTELVPVPHHHLDFWRGELRIGLVDEQSGILKNEFDAPDPAKYIVHRGHLLTTPDQYGGPFRSLVFWWLLSALSKDWWARFLDKYGSPFLVGKYPDNDEGAKGTLESAFAWASRIGGIVVSAEASVEIKQAAASDSGEAYKTFLEVCNREKSKLILGHALSADAQPTGLGSGQSNNSSDVAAAYHKYDAAALANTLRNQLFAQALSAARLIGPVPTISWGTVSVEEMTAHATLLTALKTAGLEPDDEALAIVSERAGYTLRRSPIAPSGFPSFLPPDTSTPGAPPPTAAAVPAEDVSKTALTSIQISALKDLAADVASGILPEAAALAIASASFPSIGPDLLESIFAPLRGFKPADLPPAPKPATFAADPDGQSVDRIVADATAGLSRTLRNRYAEVLRLLRDAPDPATFTASVRALLSSSPGANPDLESTLQTAAAKALLAKP